MASNEKEILRKLKIEIRGHGVVDDALFLKIYVKFQSDFIQMVVAKKVGHEDYEDTLDEYLNEEAFRCVSFYCKKD